MKNFLLAIVATLLIGVSAHAQTTPKAKKAQADSSALHMKKDGTPDKRYKENKKPATVHLKKDSTPDMRYKENKKKQKQ